MKGKTEEEVTCLKERHHDVRRCQVLILTSCTFIRTTIDSWNERKPLIDDTIVISYGGGDIHVYHEDWLITGY